MKNKASRFKDSTDENPLSFISFVQKSFPLKSLVIFIDPFTEAPEIITLMVSICVCNLFPLGLMKFRSYLFVFFFQIIDLISNWKVFNGAGRDSENVFEIFMLVFLDTDPRLPLMHRNFWILGGWCWDEADLFTLSLSLAATISHFSICFCN